MVKKDNSENNIANIACSIQNITNELILFYSKRLRKITKQKNLCYAGGVALNATANTVLLKKSGFENIYIPSAPGDSGVSIGSAFYGFYDLARNTRIVNPVITTPYMGKVYNEKSIKVALNKYKDKIIIEKYTVENLLKSVAYLLSENKIIAWFQDASEFGPRALGNRSILANPIYDSNRDRLNVIKNRESFRPVAPVMIAEDLNKYFSYSKKSVADSLSYMLFTLTPLDKKIVKKIPAVVHVDGTSRLQTITKSQNELLYNLIKEFAIISNIPVLINTSFNIKGEPMVETPDEAVRTFIASDLDFLVINNYIIKKHE